MKRLMLFFCLTINAYASDHPGSELFKKNVYCTFAPRATLWSNNHKWDTRLTVAENMNLFKRDLDEYIDHVNDVASRDEEPVSAFSIEAPADYYATDIVTFGQWVRAVLKEINSDAIEYLQDLQPEFATVYRDDGWQFTYRGIRLFVVTTAPFYPKSNSRYSGGDAQKWAVLHLQPEYVFGWKFAHLPKGVTKQVRKDGIRRAFARHDRDYYSQFASIMGGDLGFKTHEAPRYVKPIYPDDDVVKWWLEDYSIDLDWHTRSYRERFCSIQ